MLWFDAIPRLTPTDDIRLSLEKICAPFKSRIKSSRVGMTCRVRSIARLGTRISIQIRTSSCDFGFGTTKIGLTQGVGPSTRSIMSLHSRRASSTSTFFRWWKGIRLCCGMHVGWIEWSMYKCICRSLSLPIPCLRMGYLTNLSLTVLTWLCERCNRPKVFAVWPLNRFPWSPFTTTKSVVMDLSAECKTSRNWPSTGITVPPSLGAFCHRASRLSYAETDYKMFFRQ